MISEAKHGDDFASRHSGAPLFDRIAERSAVAAPDANWVGRSDKDLTPKVPAAAPTQVGTAAMGTPASLQMLLLGTFGAIAFSWLTGSYLMARMQRRPKRPVVLNPRQSSTGEPTHHGHPNLARTDDSQFDAPSRPGSRRTRAIIGPPEDVLGDNACEIHQLLARFANQEGAEPEKTRTSVPELYRTRKASVLSSKA